MVGEFPELQGLMGRYYAEAGGIKPEIARAIELHYKPKGPTDTVPRVEEGDATAVAVALADKLDTLVGFWAIGEKPTGSGDPYQLRRAALGVIRIVLENDLRVAAVARLSYSEAQAIPFEELGGAAECALYSSVASPRVFSTTCEHPKGAVPTFWGCETCSRSSPTVSRCTCATRARGTT